MAHPPHIKGLALALLLTGKTPYQVAKQTGVPLTTVKRWQKEAFAMIRPYVGDPLAEAAELLRRPCF